jgi:hypothetical protein
VCARSIGSIQTLAIAGFAQVPVRNGQEVAQPATVNKLSAKGNLPLLPQPKHGAYHGDLFLWHEYCLFSQFVLRMHALPGKIQFALFCFLIYYGELQIHLSTTNLYCIPPRGQAPCIVYLNKSPALMGVTF